MSDTDNAEADISIPPQFEGEEISLPAIADPFSPAPKPSGSSPLHSTFVPGDLLANRYRILSLIAHGGMGEVYKAEDLELGQNIAIKTILPAIAGDPKALALLKSEVSLSLRVTHPNVCRIFNLDCHRSASAEDLPIWFVTMELLDGHTLSREIQKLGKISIERTLPIAEQMAEGLEAARRASIVHGDFKSGNVILVPTDGSIRAVITDFGLARTLEVARNFRVAQVGTPVYMAPEQVKGEELSPQTDVYSFGVVLYEMITGHWPFNADTAERIAAKRLTESPTPPVRFVPDLDPVWNRVILKCLAREPSERYGSALAAIEDITGRSKSRKRKLVAAACLFLVLLGLFAFARYKQLWLFRPKPEVAVMGWQNKSGDPSQAWISTELSERLTNTLQQSTTDNVIPLQEVERAKVEFSVPEDKDLEQEDLTQFRTALGANSFITGSYEVHKDGLTVDGVLQNAMGRELARFHEEGTVQNFDQVVSGVAAKLGSELDRAPSTARSVNIYPRSPEARKLYFEALERQRSFDSEGARSRLQQVIALESDSIAAHMALAETWSYLMHDHEAAAEAKTAVDLARSQDLPFELIQATEARYAELQFRWSDAAERYKALHEALPSRLNYSLSYAQTLTNSGQPAAALKFLDELAKSPPPIGDDPRIQMMRVDSFRKLGDYTSALQAAEAALDQSVARKLKLVEAAAQEELCWVQINLGHNKEAVDACDVAQGIYTAFGDYVNAKTALSNIATIRGKMGDYAGAEMAYQSVLEATRKAGATGATEGTLLNLAGVELQAGNLESAQTHITESLQLAKQVGNTDDEAKAHIIQADLFNSKGQIAQSNQELETAASLAQAFGDVDTQGYVESNLGDNAMEAGDLKSAQHHFEEGIRLRRQIGQQDEVAVALDKLGTVFMHEAEFALAQEKYDEALAIHKQLDQLAPQAEVWLDIAELDLAQGKPDAAIDHAGQALRTFQQESKKQSEAEAHIALANAKLAQKRYAEATSELDGARAIAGHDDGTQQEIDLTQAALLTETNHADQALVLAQRIADSARKSGDREGELEAELEVLKAKSRLEPDRKVAARMAADFRKDAERAGFMDLALRASSIN